jgi:hypothetical protein
MNVRAHDSVEEMSRLLCSRASTSACDELALVPMNQLADDARVPTLVFVLAALKDPECIPVIEGALRARPELIPTWQAGWNGYEDYFFHHLPEWERVQPEWQQFYRRLFRGPDPLPEIVVEDMLRWFADPELGAAFVRRCIARSHLNCGQYMLLAYSIERYNLHCDHLWVDDWLWRCDPATVCYYARQLPSGEYLLPLQRIVQKQDPHFAPVAAELLQKLSFGMYAGGSLQAACFDRAASLDDVWNSSKDVDSVRRFLSDCLPNDPLLDDLLLHCSADARLADAVAPLLRPSLLPGRRETIRAARDNVILVTSGDVRVKELLSANGVLTTTWERATDRFMDSMACVGGMH